MTTNVQADPSVGTEAPAPTVKPAKQRTLAGEAVVHGVGFVNAADVTVRFRPAPANTGFVFVRVDLPGQPRIPATIDHVIDRKLRTTLQAGSATVEMTEHVLAALAGLSVDNCIIEINGSETPGVDGSCLPFVEAFDQAGFHELDVPRIPFIAEDSFHVGSSNGMVAIHPGAVDRLDVTFNLDYPNNPGVGKQSLMFSLTPDKFRREIAPARTFVLEREVEALKKQGLGKRASAQDLLIFRDDGSLVDNQLRFPDECVRHKILDVIGDLALFGRPIAGHVLAHKSGHSLNAALVKRLSEHSDHVDHQRLMIERPLLDSTQIEKIVPHRFPFLLVDRVLLLDPNCRAIGVKNVSYNEPFFQGHWPGRPVMPGVLIVEAMAQLAGIMLTQWQENGSYALIISMNGIKLRRPVTPGDQLRLEAEAIRVKSRTATLRTTAHVHRDLVAEAVLNFVLVNEGERFPND